MVNALTVKLGVGVMFVGCLIILGGKGISAQMERNSQWMGEAARDFVSHSLDQADLAPRPTSTMLKLSDDGRRNVIWCSDDGEGRIGWRVERRATAQSWAPELKVVTSDNIDYPELMGICEAAFRG